MSIPRAAGRLAAGATAAALCITGFLSAAPAVAESENLVVPNGGFEKFTTADSWIAADWSMTNTAWLTDAAAHTGTYSQAVNQWNGATTLSQQLTAPEGTYDVSLFVWANESLGSSTLLTNGTSTPIASGGATQIDGTKTWDEIRVENVAVGPDGSLEIQIVLPAFTSTTLTGFIDDVTVTAAVENPEEPEPSDSFLTEPGFEEGGAVWNVGGEVLNEGRDCSAHSIRHAAAGTTRTTQLVTNLEDGYYRLTAWVQNDGVYDEAYIFAAGGGTSDARTAIPRTNFAYDTAGTWKRTTLRGVQVSNGQLEVGLLTDGVGGTVLIDDLAPRGPQRAGPRTE